MAAHTSRLKVLLTANTAWNLAHFRGGLIAALRSDGHEIKALAPLDDGVRRLETMGVSTRALVIDPKGTSPMEDGKLVARFRVAFREEAPDLVLSYTIKNNIYGGLAARSLGLPFLPNVSGLGTAFLSSWWLERVAVGLYRSAFRSLPHVVFQNDDDRQLFVQKRIVRHTQTVLVPGSGVDLNRFAVVPLPGQLSRPVFVLIARLLRDKGIHEYAEAARQVRANVPGARFLLVGPTGAENRSAIDRATVAEWGAEGVVEYLGTTVDVRPTIATADCVVLPSYREGLPRTLLEGAAMGRPLIATDVPGCRDVVLHGRNGFLCAARDPSALAQAMLAMIALGPGGRAAYGAASRKLAEAKFSEDQVISVYRDAIASLTLQRSRGVNTGRSVP